ncbi:hypothetical protein [Bacillus cereus group sp. BfR-BA-01382]|uniref:hypothetical protein n=1 Tax=Bacillus cereus group sp. BfR-BA-01382 TaxID=2920326 RepID=UPI001F5674B4
MNTLKNKKGYVSIESMIISSLVIAFSMFLVINYSSHTNNITDKTAKSIDTSIHEYKVVSPE